MIVDVEVVVAKQRLEDVILPTISRVKSNFEYQSERQATFFATLFVSTALDAL